MKRTTRALAGVLCLGLPLSGLTTFAAVAPGAASVAPAPAPAIDLETLTGLEAVRLMETGKLTSVELTQMYIDRINALNKSGPGLNAFTQLNKHALEEAAHADELRSQGTVLGPSMGLPILMKDLIDVKGMYTSAGNYSLRNSYPEQDAGLVEKLRENGVVILGKVGLSEYANYFGNQPSGFGNLTGQVLNGVDADQNPSGSSSGTGSSMAAALSLLGIGTETSGSIISPSRANGLVGLRPTVGLVPGTGIAPISASQDTAGPMTRTVEDAALTLQSIAGYDAENAAYYQGIWGTGIADEEIIPPVPDTVPDYTTALDLDFVQGKRIGYNGTLTDGTPLKAAYDALVAAGAVMVERPTINVGSFPSSVLAYEAHRDIDHYYRHLGPDAPIKSLEEELKINERESHQALKFGHNTHKSAFAQDISPDSADTAAYKNNVLVGKQLAHEGIDRMMANDTPDDSSDDFIAILGSVPQGARAGYPQITIPMGYNSTNRRTLDVSVHGGAYDERDLLGVAYVIEQATELRQPASEVNPSMYRCADTVPAPPYAERGACNPDYDAVMAMLGGQAPEPLPFSLETESAQSLAERLRDGTLTSTELTKAYLYRIALSNAEGPATQAVRTVAADALAQAADADAELVKVRAGKRTAGPLLGLPVLVNDGFDEAGTPTTGGSIALQDRTPTSDSAVVANLKAAGAIYLGATNVTELGGVVDAGMPAGYSSLGGQVLLPSDTDKTPAGSSAGSAAATASGLAALTIGSETGTDSAELLAPSNAAGVVGLKPTVGLVSRTGSLPVARSQDSPGPITRTVYDAAAALTAIAGPDVDDEATSDALVLDYTSSLRTTGLEGKRIAVLSTSSAPYSTMVSAVQGAGASTTVVSPVAPANVASIVPTELKRDLDAYLGSGATGGASSLAEIVAYNAANPAEGLKYQQRGLESAVAIDLDDPATASAYEADLDTGRAANRAAIDDVLTNGTPNDTSDDFDAVLVPAGHNLIGYADRAGYPALTIPAGYGVETSSSGHNPIGVTLVGTAFSESTLLDDAYALEQAIDVRKAPSYTNPSMWRCVPGSTFFTGAFCNTGDRLLLNADPDQGVIQVDGPADTSVSGTPVSVTFGKAVTLRVRVAGLPDQPKGTVAFTEGNRSLGKGSIEGDGSASLTLRPRTLSVGKHRITATYTGDGGTASGQVVVTVRKAGASVKGLIVPKRVVAGQTRAKLKVAVDGIKGVTATGVVKIKGKGFKNRTVRLTRGTASVRLPKFRKPGKRTLKLVYSGSSKLQSARGTVTVRVVRK